MIIVLSFIIFLIGSFWTLYKSHQEQQIRDRFSSTLEMYPIKNLEDLYDKEGYRDENFDKDDKGEWVLQSNLLTQKGNAPLIQEGMVLYLNRNNREATGFYRISKISEDNKGYPVKKTQKYPVKLVNNKFKLLKSVDNAKLKHKIKNFKFFSQYANFKELSNYDQNNISYNPNVPMYSVEYQLSNDDYNVKQLRKHYDIPSNKAPKLELSGTGNLEGSSVGYKKVEYLFIRSKQKLVKSNDYIKYQPTR